MGIIKCIYHYFLNPFDFIYFLTVVCHTPYLNIVLACILLKCFCVVNPVDLLDRGIGIWFIMTCSNWKKSLENSSVKPGRHFPWRGAFHDSVILKFQYPLFFIIFSVKCSCTISIFSLF